MDFRVANRLWADNGRNVSVQSWLCLKTLTTRVTLLPHLSQISTAFNNNFVHTLWFLFTHTQGTRIHQRWVISIHFIEWTLNWAFFRLHNRLYFISHTKSYNSFKFSTAVSVVTRAWAAYASTSYQNDFVYAFFSMPAWEVYHYLCEIYIFNFSKTKQMVNWLWFFGIRDLDVTKISTSRRQVSENKLPLMTTDEIFTKCLEIRKYRTS